MNPVRHLPSVLFVCTGNMYRSPLAAAYLRRLLKDKDMGDWRVESAGTWTVSRRPLPRDAVTYAQLLGIDLSGHTTRVVTEDLLRDFDLVLVMERGQKEALNAEFPGAQGRVKLLSEMVDEGFDIPDPALAPSQQDQVLREMLGVIERGFARIRDLANQRAGSGS